MCHGCFTLGKHLCGTYFGTSDYMYSNSLHHSSKWNGYSYRLESADSLQMQHLMVCLISVDLQHKAYLEL